MTVLRGSVTSNRPSSKLGVARPIKHKTMNLISVPRVLRQSVIRRCKGKKCRLTVHGEYPARAREATEAKHDVCRARHCRVLVLLGPLETIEARRVVTKYFRVFVDGARHRRDEGACSRKVSEGGKHANEPMPRDGPALTFRYDVFAERRITSGVPHGGDGVALQTHDFADERIEQVRFAER